MRNHLYYSLSKYLKNKTNTLNSKNLLFHSLKNYYLTIKRYKYVPLYSGRDGINFIYSNMFFLNLLQNKGMDK